MSCTYLCVPECRVAVKDVIEWREGPRGQVLEIQGRPRAAKGGGGEAFKDVPEWRERAFKDVPEWREGPISFHKFCCILVFIFIYFQIFFDI